MGYVNANFCGMPNGKKQRLTTIQLPVEMQAAFAKWCDSRSRKIAPTARGLFAWFLRQSNIVQDFILAVPETREALAPALLEMAR